MPPVVRRRAPWQWPPRLRPRPKAAEDPFAASCVGIVDGFQRDEVAVDQPLAGMLEIHGDAVADHRLNLAQAPLGLERMADKRAGDEALGHGRADLRAAPGVAGRA